MCVCCIYAHTQYKNRAKIKYTHIDTYTAHDGTHTHKHYESERSKINNNNTHIDAFAHNRFTAVSAHTITQKKQRTKK